MKFESNECYYDIARFISQLFIYFSLKSVVSFKDTLACVAFDPVCVYLFFFNTYSPYFEASSRKLVNVLNKFTKFID